MGELDGLPSREVEAALTRAGFERVAGRGKGSHRAFTRSEPGGVSILVIVPMSRSLPIGTVRAILRQAGLTREQFLDFLK